MENPGTSVSLRLTNKWFNDEYELARIIAELIPAPDFPLKISSANYNFQIPSLKMDSEDENLGVFNLDTDGSKVILRLNDQHDKSTLFDGNELVIQEMDKSKKTLALIQDGILV